ncbi:hypothetical protein Taro_007795, partial [Colocasia esculenta]|nr:hypothetical protein [Colocasia esculenta]
VEKVPQGAAKAAKAHARGAWAHLDLFRQQIQGPWMAGSGRLGESDPADPDSGRVGSVEPADSNGVWPTLGRPE